MTIHYYSSSRQQSISDYNSDDEFDQYDDDGNDDGNAGIRLEQMDIPMVLTVNSKSETIETTGEPFSAMDMSASIANSSVPNLASVLGATMNSSVESSLPGFGQTQHGKRKLTASTVNTDGNTADSIPRPRRSYVKPALRDCKERLFAKFSACFLSDNPEDLREYIGFTSKQFEDLFGMLQFPQRRRTHRWPIADREMLAVFLRYNAR